MNLNLTQIARSSFALSAVALAAWASNAQAADTDIVWTFTESYSRTDTTPTPGEPGVSSVTGSRRASQPAGLQDHGGYLDDRQRLPDRPRRWRLLLHLQRPTRS